MTVATYPEWWTLTNTEHGPVTICVVLGVLAVVRQTIKFMK